MLASGGSSAAESAESAGTAVPPRPWSVVVWRRPPSSAVHTSVASAAALRALVRGGVEEAGAAIAGATRRAAREGHRPDLPHRLVAPNIHLPSSKRASTVRGPHVAVRGDPIHVGGSRVSMRRSSSSGSGASGNCRPRLRARPAPGLGSRPRRSGAGRPAWGRCPLGHAADELQRVEEGRVVLAGTFALGHDAVGLGVHRARYPLRRGELGVLGRLARRVGARPVYSSSSPNMCPDSCAPTVCALPSPTVMCPPRLAAVEERARDLSMPPPCLR